MQRALGKGFSKEEIRALLSVKEKFPHSLINVVENFPPPLRPSGIEPFFFEQGNDVPDPRELDPTRKNLMVFDDLMLSKQNKCEDYYVRGHQQQLLPVPKLLQTTAAIDP